MSICLMMIGDGRTEYHERSLASVKENIDPQSFDQVVTVDDSDHIMGFAGAIQHGWEQVRTDYVFHLELDFTLNWRVDLEPIIQTLKDRKYLTQIALLRNPVNDAERDAGGVIGQFPDSYEQLEMPDGRAWIEHSRHFTTNPCVYPAWIVGRGWPQRTESEGHFGMQLFEEDPARRSAYWGHGEQWVKHVGDERAGKGY